MGDLSRRIVRGLAFFHKEVAEVLRQPKLMLSLVLGPFLILALFGVGYRNDRDPLRTIAVAPEGSNLREVIEEVADEAGDRIDFLGIIADEEEALDEIRAGRADVVVVVPEDPENTIRSGEQAEFQVWHDELDPFSKTQVVFVASQAVEDLNRRILEDFAAYSQEETERLNEALPTARAATIAAREAMERGDAEEANRQLAVLNDSIATLDSGYRPSAELLGTESGATVTGALDDLRDDAEAISDPAIPFSSRIERAREAEANLAEFEEQLEDFQAISPDVLVSPFDSQTDSLSPVFEDVTAYYAPGVVVLLLQHLAITFAALSIVRERTLGTVELFRAAPLTAGETLTGKTLGYLVFGGSIAAALTGMMLVLFKVPMRGSWGQYVLLMLGVLAVSIGVGFVISAVSENETQAVQYSMIALLAAIFFSGFFLTLDRLHPTVRGVAKLIPGSYGIQGLQDVMFRGAPVDGSQLLSLTGYGMLVFLLAWLLLRRRFATR